MIRMSAELIDFCAARAARPAEKKSDRIAEDADARHQLDELTAALNALDALRPRREA
jgi:hypothetical protein